MIAFDLGNGTGESDVQSQLQRLASEHETMQQVVEVGGYSDDRASLNLLDDSTLLDRIKKASKPYQDADTIVLLGMGGPGLGAKAVQEALSGTLHNYTRRPRVFYLDTVDPTRAVALTKLIAADLKTGRKVVSIVATQSGGTTETIATLATFAALYEQHGLNASESMPLVTNEDSRLDQWGKANGYTRILVPPKIGGRFSVFSAIGLFPLAILGLDIQALVHGAREFRDRALSGPLEQSPSALSATTVAHHYHQGRNVHVLFLFAPELESLGLWCRQIMAESIGKSHDRENKEVHVGITPTVAVGSRDLHSTFQLYMEGPDDKFTTFVRVQDTPEIQVPDVASYDSLVPHLSGKSFRQLSDAILEGVLHAYREHERPYTVVTVPKTSPENIGSFLQFKMMETMYLGALLNVNPFDQPGVEGYKRETKRLLATV